MLPLHSIPWSWCADGFSYLVAAGAGALLWLVVAQPVAAHGLSEEALLANVPLLAGTLAVHLGGAPDGGRVALELFVSRTHTPALAALGTKRDKFVSCSQLITPETCS